MRRRLLFSRPIPMLLRCRATDDTLGAVGTDVNGTVYYATQYNGLNAFRIITEPSTPPMYMGFRPRVERADP